MVRITFLIGNGFDINIGLRTKYKDFYEFYIKKCPNDMLAKDIGRNYEYWSDLEFGLGRYTGKVKTTEVKDFWKSEENLERELADYLKAQMNRVNISNREREIKVSVEMQRSLTEFVEELPEEFARDINRVLADIKENITYSFVSYNYTYILDKCLDVTKKVLGGSSGKLCRKDGSDYQYTIGEVLHIHGTVDRQMVLGVNDEDQVANKEFVTNKLCRQNIIKEETNRRYNNGKMQNAYEIISESVVICAFGLSIGQTDKLWWRYLCEWLGKDVQRRLIIYSKIENDKPIGKYSLFAQEDEVLQRLKETADISKDLWNQINNQIYVKCNTMIFRFNIVDN